MTTNAITHDRVEAKRIGVLADTHCRTEDGSDLPEGVARAFAGVDLIVHCGDVGNAGLLRRLESMAPVLTTRNTKNPADGDLADARVIEAGDVRLGVLFDLGASGMPVEIADGKLVLDDGAAAHTVATKFGGEMVDAVLFGGTHDDIIDEKGGVLFVNPGSPTLHVKKGEGVATVAVVSIEDGRVSAEVVRV